MGHRRRSVKELTLFEEQAEKTYYSFKALSLQSFSKGTSKTEARSYIDEYQPRVIRNIVEMARSNATADSPYPSQPKDKQFWKFTSGQKQDPPSLLTDYFDNYSSMKNTQNEQEENQFKEEIRIYHNGRLVSENQWNLFISGECNIEEDQSQNEQENDEYLYLEEDDPENDPASEEGDLALMRILEDFNDANSLNSECSTATPDSSDIDELILQLSRDTAQQ